MTTQRQPAGDGIWRQGPPTTPIVRPQPGGGTPDTERTTPPQHSDEDLRKEVTFQVHDVARKSQLDYYAVNSPNGIRSGESSNHLVDFLEVNIDQIMAAVEAELKKREAAAELQGRMNECHYVRQYLHFDYYQPSHITYFSKRLYDLEDLAQLHKEHPKESK